MKSVLSNSFILAAVIILLLNNSGYAQDAASDSGKDTLKISLDKCLELALNNNELIKSSALEISIAESQHDQAKSANYPSLNLRSSLAWLDEDPNYIFPSFKFDLTGVNLGFLNLPPITVPQQNIKLMDKLVVESELKLVYPLFTGGKISAIQGQTESNIEVAKQSFENVKSELRYNTSKAYYGFVMLSELLSIGRTASIRLQATLSLTENLYKKGSGSVTKLDYLKNKMIVESVKGLVKTLEGKHKAAVESLKFLLALNSDQSISAADDTLRVPSPLADKDELIATVLENNPRLKKVDHALEIYSNRISEAKSGLWPNLAVFGFYKRTDNDYHYGYVTNDNKNQFGIGIGMEFPVFEGFRTVNKIEQAELEFEKLQRERNLLKNSLIMELNKLYGEINSARERVASANEARSAARENHSLTKRAYQNNMAPIEDYLQSQIMDSFMSAQYDAAVFDLIDLNLQLDKLTNSGWNK